VQLGVAVGTTQTTVAAQDRPGDLAVHHGTGALAEPRALAELAVGGRPLRELRAQIDAVVVAVPDSWLHASTAGAWRRERLRWVISDELGLPLPRVVGRTGAAAVALAGPERGDELRAARLICDIDATTVSVARCACAGPAIQLIDIEIADVARDPADSRCGRLFALVRAASPHQHGRARLALPQARRLPRYRATPVYDTGPADISGPVTAGQVLDCYEPVADAVRAAVLGLLARHRGPGSSRGGGSGGGPLALAGELGAFPLAQEVVLDALTAPDSGAWPATGCTVLDEGAVARGALLVAAGAAELADLGDRAGHTLRLPLRQIAAGQLVAAGADLAGVGAPLVVEVASPARPLEVEVRDEGSGTCRTLVADGPPAPPGQYAVGFWPNRRDLGVVVLRPVGGGEPLMYSVAEPGRTSREGAG
jgi:hypothetical protein